MFDERRIPLLVLDHQDAEFLFDKPEYCPTKSMPPPSPHEWGKGLKRTQALEFKTHALRSRIYARGISLEAVAPFRLDGSLKLAAARLRHRRAPQQSCRRRAG